MAGRALLAAAAALICAASPVVNKQVEQLRAAALAGDADAAYRLGRAYKVGEGVAADARQAERWFDEAARRGHARAGDELGLVLHQSGKSMEALPWLRRAAERGDPRAQYALGTVLFAGSAGSDDPAEAKRWMRRAAAAGLPAAEEALAVMNAPAPMPEPAGKQGYEIVTVAPASAEPASRSGRWQAQLGAFSVATNARRRWRQVGDEAGAGLTASFPIRGKLTMLRVGPFASRQTAERFCSTERGKGRECVAVSSAPNGE